MLFLDKAENRALVNLADAAAIAELAKSGALTLAREGVDDTLQQGPVVLDGLRRRPRYFDGRFLTGADLTRDQDYVRQRQADMARAGGVGVIAGLQVSDLAGVQGQVLRITSGLGLTPSGDLVMLGATRDVPLLDLPVTRQLDAVMGLSEQPRVPLGRRTGLYILALRPVEFTANPIAAYPRSITGKRTVEDGDIIEASAITLIPYPDHSGAANINDARRMVARAIFLGRGVGLPQDALPLAMLGLDRGTLRWIDAAMVRREVGAESGVHAMLGTRPRAVAEAFALQHRQHLADVLTDLAGRGQSPVFPAASTFSLLPPVGLMPAAAIQPDSEAGFAQFYFPPGVDVDVALVPSDEIPALVEEALALPPIDLQAPAATIDATGVTVLVPVARSHFRLLRDSLASANLSVATSITSPVPRSAFDTVASLVARRLPPLTPSAADQAAAQAADQRNKAWQSAYATAVAALAHGPGGTPLVWYTRRRSVAEQPRVLGTGVGVSSDDIGLSATVDANIVRLGLDQRLAAIDARATPQATVRLMTLLASPGVAGSAVLATSVITDMEKVLAAAIQAATPHIPIETILPRVPVLNPAINPAVATTTPVSPPTAPSAITPPVAPGTTPPIIALNPAAIAAIRTAPVTTTLSPLTSKAALSASVAAFSAAPSIPTTIATPPSDSVPTPTPPIIPPATPPSTDAPAPGATTAAPIPKVSVPPAQVILPPTGTTLLALGGGLLIGETQVAGVAANYADPRLGDGLARAAAALATPGAGGDPANPWPTDPDVLWFGQSGLALVVDAAFRSVAAERLADSATLLKTAVGAKNAKAVTDLVQQIT